MQSLEKSNNFDDMAGSSTAILLDKGESLYYGIFPRSIPLLMSAFYVALFIVRPWEQLFPFLSAIRFERTYAIVMILTVFLSSKRARFAITWQTATVIFFIFAILLSVVLAFSTATAWDGFYDRYLSLLVFYFILLVVIRTPYELMFIIISFVTTMGVYLAKSQWEFFVNGQNVFDMGVHRLCGIESTYGGPNALAMSVVASMPLAMFLWRNLPGITASWPNVWKKRFRIGLIIYAALAVSSVILTNSRSGLLGMLFFVAMLIFGGQGFFRKMKYLVSGILLLLLLWIFVPEENKERFQTIWSPESGPDNAQISAEGRLEGFKVGMEMFARHPLSGVGFGNFLIYRQQKVDGVYLESHNLEGQLLGELGLIGGVAFLLMIGAAFQNCRKIRRYSAQSEGVHALIFPDLAKAISQTLWLLIFLGTFGHNLYRYNWLWLAAFAVLAWQMLQKRLAASPTGLQPQPDYVVKV